MMHMTSLPPGYRALVIGASGGIGSAALDALRADPRCGEALGLSRADDGFDLTDEASVAAHAGRIEAPVHLIFHAAGALQIGGDPPEKALSRLKPEAMAAQFALNAIGPALVFKHFAALLPKRERGLIGVLTARIGSIEDNRLGGWISYRAAKAAANQVIRTAAIELARTRPQARVLALHPGTVRTALTEGRREGRETLSAEESAARLLGILDHAQDSGRFYAHDGAEIPW